MQIFQLESEDAIYVVIAKDADRAKEIVIEEYDLDDDTELNVIESKEVSEGAVLEYDYEDFYWHD